MANITLRAVKGSALTFQEADDNINNLNTAKLESVSADTTPSLGGNLDVGSNAIITTDASGIIQMGPFVSLSGVPFLAPLTQELFSGLTSGANATLVLAQNNADLTKPGIAVNNDGIGFNSAIGAFNPEMFVGSFGVAFSKPIISTPDNDLTIWSGTNRDIILSPNGTGNIELNNITYPKTDGSSGQVLTTNGSGVLSFTSLPAAGIASVSADTTPSLGGNLDVGSNAIVTTDASGIIQMGPFVSLSGVPFLAPLTQELFSGITSGANATLVLAQNNADLTKPGIAVNDEGIGFNTALGAFNPEMFVGSFGVAFSKSITSTPDNDLTIWSGTNRDIILSPNGTGNIQLNNITYPKTDGSSGQVLTTNGSGVLSFANRVASSDVLNIVKITQAAYDALNPPVSTTLYLIEEE